MTKETLKQTGYIHFKTLGNGEHLLCNKNTGESEIWFCNKDHASYGIIYKNTHLEFVRSYCFIIS